MLPALTLLLMSKPRAASLTVGFEFTQLGEYPAQYRPSARNSLFLTGAHRLRKYNGMPVRPMLSNTILVNLTPFVDCRVSTHHVPNGGYSALARVRFRAGPSRGPQEIGRAH